MKEYSLTGVGVYDATLDFLGIVNDYVESLNDYDLNKMVLPSYLSSADLLEDPNSVATAAKVGSAKIQLGKRVGEWAYLLMIDDEQVSIGAIKASRTNW